MRRLYASFCYRLRYGETLGKTDSVYVLDLNTFSLLDKVNVELGYDIVDYKVGKSHGVRGITIHNNMLCIAGSMSDVSFFDLATLERIGKVNIPCANGLHQVQSYGGRVYLVSTRNDKYISFLVNTNNGIECTDIQEVSIDSVEPYINHDFSTHKPWGKDRVHFNSINWDDQGLMYHVYHACSTVFNFTEKKVVCTGGLLRLPHDVVFHGNDIIVNSSANHTTVAIDRYTGKSRVVFETDKVLHKFDPELNDFGGTRGLVTCGEYLFVGSYPVNINVLRRCNNGLYILEDVKCLTKASNEAIFSMVIN